MNKCFCIILNRINIKFYPILVHLLENGLIFIACKAEVFAPESTRAFIVGIPNSGNEHHSSLPTITLLLHIYFFNLIIIEITTFFIIRIHVKKNLLIQSGFSYFLICYG